MQNNNSILLLKHKYWIIVDFYIKPLHYKK